MDFHHWMTEMKAEFEVGAAVGRATVARDKGRREKVGLGELG